MIFSPRGKRSRRFIFRKSPHRPRCELGEMRMQVFDALRVDFGTVGGDVAAPEQELRQHPHPAADLQHVAGDCTAPSRLRGRRCTGSGRIRRDPGIGPGSQPGTATVQGSDPGIGTSIRPHPGIRTGTGISSHICRGGFPGTCPRPHAPRKRIANLARDIESTRKCCPSAFFALTSLIFVFQ